VSEITIHETQGPTGQLVRTRLHRDDGRLVLSVDGAMMPLPEGALDAVMKRYGKPLGIADHELVPEEKLDVGDGRTLVRFRFMARYDVIARDYLALLDPEAEALCELAISIAAALDHLARRFAEG
jgi:hypothetical protein